MDRLTIKDVAKAAGVHPATASRALNPRLPGRISAETTEKVARAAAALGYVVDPVGRSLRTKRSGTIGVLVPDLLNPFYPPLLRGVEHALRASGFEALLASTDNDVRREADLLALFRSRRCEGYLVATASRDFSAVDELVREGVPVVLVNRLAATEAPSVTSDDRPGISQAVAHLRELGHTRIGHVTGPAGISVTEAREDAFRAAMGASLDERWIVRAERYTADAGERACHQLLTSGDELLSARGQLLTGEDRPVTAILAGNDMIAVGCLAAFDRLGLRCPDDISLVGINNMPLAEWLRPSLTTVAIPQEELGARAARLLIERLEHEDVTSVSLTTELIVRRSTGPRP